MRFRAGFFAGFFVCTGLGASDPGGALSFVTGRPTWSRETTYAA